CLAGASPAAAGADRALDVLRGIDSKAQVAYVLDHLAALDLAAGRIAEARRRAVEAVASAEAVGRRSETAVARAVFAESARGRGARPVGAGGALGPVLPQLADADRLPARARRALIDAARALGLPIPTPAPTRAPTRAP